MKHKLRFLWFEGILFSAPYLPPVGTTETSPAGTHSPALPGLSRPAPPTPHLPGHAQPLSLPAHGPGSVRTRAWAERRPAPPPERGHVRTAGAILVRRRAVRRPPSLWGRCLAASGPVGSIVAVAGLWWCPSKFDFPLFRWPLVPHGRALAVVSDVLSSDKPDASGFVGGRVWTDRAVFLWWEPSVVLWAPMLYIQL